MKLNSAFCYLSFPISIHSCEWLMMNAVHWYGGVCSLSDSQQVVHGNGKVASGLKFLLEEHVLSTEERWVTSLYTQDSIEENKVQSRDDCSMSLLPQLKHERCPKLCLEKIFKEKLHPNYLFTTPSNLPPSLFWFHTLWPQLIPALSCRVLVLPTVLPGIPGRGGAFSSEEFASVWEPLFFFCKQRAKARANSGAHLKYIKSLEKNDPLQSGWVGRVTDGSYLLLEHTHKYKSLQLLWGTVFVSSSQNIFQTPDSEREWEKETKAL